MALFYAGVRFGVIFIFLSRYLLLRMSLEAAALMGGFLKKYLILLFLSNWWVESAKQVCGTVEFCWIQRSRSRPGHLILIVGQGLEERLVM